MKRRIMMNEWFSSEDDWIWMNMNINMIIEWMNKFEWLNLNDEWIIRWLNLNYLENE